DYKVTGVQTCALPISSQRDHAAEARGPPRRRHVTEAVEQEPPASPVVEPRAAESRRVKPRLAAERVHLEPGVVAERQRPGQLGRSEERRVGKGWSAEG